MAAVDPAFRLIPRNSSFFLVWRIEKMQVVPIPKDSYGVFYTGDSYIVACATEGSDTGDSQMKSKEAKGYVQIHIHFWLGNDTSQDEAGVAAYKTVELDDHLGGSPIQHREVQEFESKRFISYFKKGIRFLSGGIASGFNHVTNSKENRLFQIKGKRKPIIRQLPTVSWHLMNDGDVFIVDANQIVFVWTGKYANHMEKIQGASVAQQLRSERSGTGIVFVEDGQEDKMTIDEKNCFNEILILKEKKVKSHSAVAHDEVIEKKQRTEIKLYRCSDEGGTLKVTEIKSGPLDQKDLLSQDSFIVDNGENGIWVWVGKRASPKERTEAMRNAQGFIKKKNYSNHTQVTRIIDGGEPPEFKSLFRSWIDLNQTMSLGRSTSSNKIAKTIQTKFDASTLHDNPHLAAETQMVDDGSGSKEVFQVINFDLVPLDEKEHGKFFSGDCYVVVYAYSDGKSDHFLVYYWLGTHSTVDERATAAMKTVELDDKLHGKAIQIRVIQGKEPPHFMAIFGGKMLVFQGGAKSGFNNSNEENHLDIPKGSYLLHVRGTTEYNTKAIQVDLKASSLNSNDVFVLVSKDNTFIWAGKGSTGDEREMAKRIANTAGKEVIMAYEGQEKNDFWDAIGGQEPYANDKRLRESNTTSSTRLFQCSNASGRFTVNEIVDFDQTDLIEDDVMILDAWHTLFLWIGSKSNADEQKLASDMAEEYLSTDPSGRNTNTTVVKLRQGNEPPNFTGFFGAWDKKFWKNSKTFEELRAQLCEENPGIFVYHSRRNGEVVDLTIDKYPIEMLMVKDPYQLPEGVDPTQKELYLNADDFKQIFGMSEEEFQTVPRWKQVNMKKQAGLF